MFKKEFLNHLLGFRFVISAALCLLLMVMSVIVLTGDYIARRDDYQRNMSAYRSEAEQQGSYFGLSRDGTKVDRPPAKLQIPAYGLEKDPDKTAAVRTAGAPRVLHELYMNPLLSLFPVADVLFVVATVLSLLAFVVSYDAVSGEREEETIKLLMSYSVPRARLILAKWLGGYVSLAVPFLISAAIGSVIILLWNVDFGAEDWMSLGLLVGLSLLFLAATFSIGLFVSCICRYSSTSITVLILVWVVFVLIVPNMSPYVAAETEPVVPFSAVESEIAQETGQARERFHGKMRGRRGGMRRMFRASGPEADQARQTFIEEMLKARDEMMAEVDEIEQGKLRKFTIDQNRQVNATKNISRISPIAAYVYAATDIASTGTRKQEHFFQLLQEYQREFKQYVDEKTNASAMNFRKGFRDFHGGSQDYDVTDMPTFSYQEEGLTRRLTYSVWDVVVLVAYSIGFFFAAYVSFMRAELL
jgi:ABC-type transport system involved in multi-copper enzyme maturation permease subunit